MAIELKTPAAAEGKPLTHFWSLCVGAGRANEGLRANWQEQLKTVVKVCGFRYLRFHGLFHDDMFVYREEKGRPVYNFQYIDELFDRMLEIGIRPFVELGFCPGDLATEKGTVFWWEAHGSPPNDYAKWAELVSRTVSHWVARYGIEEVRRWYFEVWNEPNLSPFFRATKSQYLELYKVSVKAVKQVDPHLRVGGPATSNFVPDARFDGEKEDYSIQGGVSRAEDLDSLDWRPVWLAQFFDYCSRDRLPLDFVSVHPYPTDWALDERGTLGKYTRGVDATRRDLATLRRMVDESAYPAAAIHLTEWSSSPSPRDFTHDFLQAATFVVKANVESAGLVDSLSYWTFTDVFEEGGAGDFVFHGGFGMINFQGIVKPTFHAYRFLNALGDEIISTPAGGVVTRHRQTGRITALAYHYPSEMPLTVPASFDTRAKAEEVLRLGSPQPVLVELTGLPAGAPFAIETLDQSHGNAMAAWDAMGQPPTPTREQTEFLRRAAMATKQETVLADASGRLSLRRVIEPWSVMLIRQL